MGQLWPEEDWAHDAGVTRVERDPRGGARFGRLLYEGYFVGGSGQNVLE